MEKIEKHQAGFIYPCSGGLFLTAADGSNFTLDVPINALEMDTLITMTAVQSIEGAQLSDGAVAAVQLEPSGLFFNKTVTLTIVPGQEIPIEEQIIFGYEGNGQDYQLSVVDSNCREIKVKLMRFSGAGVGSGSDSAWAANLQVQANATRVRLELKFGEYTQVERRAELLASEGNPENSKVIRSYVDQYYDQIIRKEMALAEMDCQNGKKAGQDLLALERQNQILVISGEDSEGYPHPFFDGIWEKMKNIPILRLNEKNFSCMGLGGYPH